MARRRQQKDDLDDWTELLEGALGGESFLWSAPKDIWHHVTFRPKTLQKEQPDDDLHPYKWFSIEMEYPGCDGFERQEVPFWCKNDLIETLLDHKDHKSVEVDLQYKRTADGDLNFGEFK